MLGSWPNSCAATISHRSTTERTGYAVLDFCGSFPDGDGIYDLTARVFKDTRVLRAADAALGSQVPQQLFLQHSAGLDEQTAVNRFMGHAHALVSGILPSETTRLTES